MGYLFMNNIRFACLLALVIGICSVETISAVNVKFINGFNANLEITFYVSEDKKSIVEDSLGSDSGAEVKLPAVSLGPNNFCDFKLPSIPKKVFIKGVSCKDGTEDSSTLYLNWLDLKVAYPFVVSFNILISALETRIWW